MFLVAGPALAAGPISAGIGHRQTDFASTKVQKPVFSMTIRHEAPFGQDLGICGSRGATDKGIALRTKSLIELFRTGQKDGGHYRELVKLDDAELYWKMMPGGKGASVVAFEPVAGPSPRRQRNEPPGHFGTGRPSDFKRDRRGFGVFNGALSVHVKRLARKNYQLWKSNHLRVNFVCLLDCALKKGRTVLTVAMSSRE
jgi:hypothetical protein